MSDQRIRDLERRWRASGLPADHAALLLDYVRTGRLNEARLQVAAYCGHAGAAAALGIPVGRSKVPGLLSEWVLGTPRTEIGAELVVRAVVLAACGTLRSLRRRDGVLIRHLEHAAEWCDCPCEKHQRQAAWGVDPEAAIGSADLALKMCYIAALSAGGDASGRPRDWGADFDVALYRAGWPWQKNRVRRAWALLATEGAIGVTVHETTVALGSWALGDLSPIADLLHDHK